MRFSLLSISLVAAFSLQAQTADFSQQANKIAQSTLIIDTHIDVPYRLHNDWEDVTKATQRGEFDYPRAKAGGLNAPFMSIYIPSSYEKKGGGYLLANQLIDNMEALVGRAPDKFAMAYNSADLAKHFKEGKISLALGMENGTPIEGKLENLQHFYDRGIRYITLTHSESNHIADSSYDLRRQWKGLSPFGKELIKAMNETGVMVDVSHVSDDAFYQAVEISKVPVIASHSSLRAFVPGFERNMDDKMIKTLAKNGGVIQINFGSAFVVSAANQWGLQRDGAFKASGQTDKDAFTAEYKKKHPYPFASLEKVLEHIDYVKKLVGIDYVGIGSDYDGVGDSLPEQLKDVSTYPNLIRGLLERGYTEQEIEKILSGNTLRVWRAVEDYAAKH
ncbi:MAG: dipeptidase [Gammaproteobacteria bacterium]|nr:dipeptidase [Gammaproteobacteria bacterium]MBU2059338.1 dipeptidase [Gammaproteobacteria bacterium]MBU2175282.1 dipeptidase [Gammaproteobacteria bacterium]MBU2247490.1 dipeptidase [Gammaproteobacteria bacterium]MBU2342581.1 dipeptidase [Gammaproteobacteria bacterium]